MSAKETAKASNRVEILTSPVGLGDVAAQERLLTDLSTGNLPAVQELVQQIVISGGGSGGTAELALGQVATYNATNYTGTVTVGASTVNFVNGTGFGLSAGDWVTLATVDGVVNRVAISIYLRSGSYVPPIISNPQANTNFPYDGDALPSAHNPYVGLLGSTFASTNTLHTLVGFYASNVLGYTGRVVVLRGAASNAAQPPITIYHVETGSVTDVNRTPTVGSSNRLTGLGAVGTRLFATWEGTSGDCVESWDATTGTWTAHAISHAVFAGVSNNRAWWVGYSTGGSRYRVHSVDQTGTLSSIDFPTNISYNVAASSTAAAEVFAKAKNGYLWVDINTTSPSQQLVVAATNVAAASLTFSTVNSPNDLPYSLVANAGATSFHRMSTALTLSDVSATGNLYYLYQGGTPATWGFAVVSRTTLTVTRYTRVTSSTGSTADGELSAPGGLCLAGNEIVIFGTIREDLAAPLTGRSTSQVPCYWRTDGVTTSVNPDLAYVGLSSGSSGDVSAFARLVPRFDASSTFVYLTNVAETPLSSGTGSTLTAKATGPAKVDALTV